MVWSRNGREQGRTPLTPSHMGTQRIRVDPKCDRSIYLYGYNRGTYLRSGQRVHVPGVGDFTMDDVCVLDDPCPLPSRDKDKVLVLRVYVHCCGHGLGFAAVPRRGQVAFDVYWLGCIV